MILRASLLVALTCATAFAQQPRIDSVSPSQGPIAGGAVVSVTGTNFAGAIAALDGVTIAPLSQSNSEVRLQMPQHDNGLAVISLRNASGSAYGEFLYVPPALTDLPPGFITTVAGIGTFTRDYGDARQASIGVWSIELDRQGNLLVADAGAARVYRVRPDGTIERFAGEGLTFPRDIAVDGADNVYIGGDACRIHRVDRNGVMTTYAGGDVCGFAGDGGPASAAQIGQPTYLAADANDLFFIDWNAMRIRRIHFADGMISTFAGNGTAGFAGDGGPATQASINIPVNDFGALTLDPGGNVYLSDSGNGRIRRIDRVTGIIDTFYKPAQGTKDDVHEVRSLAFDAAGNLYYGGSGRIVKVSSSGAFVTAFGNGNYALPVDGAPAATSGLGHVLGIAIDAAGNILYADEAISRVRRINASTGLLDTIAGIGPAAIGENGPPLGAVLGAVNDLTFDRDGNLLIAETLRLRRLGRDGKLTTIGGTGSFIGRSAPAPMNEVVIAPASVEVTADGGIDMADLSIIDHVDANGTLRWIAGRSAVCGYSGDGGPATQATLCQAWDSVRDRFGNLFIADTNNNRIRRVDAQSGIITTVAGNGGPVNGFEKYGRGTYCGDGGPAFDACFNTPYGVAIDSAGNLLISEGARIRKVNGAGTISTLVHDLFTAKFILDGADRIYGGNKTTVQRVDADGVRTTIAGNGTAGFSGDGGPALLAGVDVFGQGAGMAIDSEGNFFFIDRQRVRAVRYGAVLAPAGATISAVKSGSAIRATVLDSNGHPAASVRVDFAAPSSGASCVLSTPFAITDAKGDAVVICTPNCLPGAYSVVAQPLTALSRANVSFVNQSVPCRRHSVHH